MTLLFCLMWWGLPKIDLCKVGKNCFMQTDENGIVKSTCSIWLKRLCSNLSSTGCSPCSLIVRMEDRQADSPSTSEVIHSALHASLINVCRDLSVSSIGFRSVNRKDKCFGWVSYFAKDIGIQIVGWFYFVVKSLLPPAPGNIRNQNLHFEIIWSLLVFCSLQSNI